MRIIKLDAVDSTNDFLKRMVDEGNAENFTVVIADKQTNGRGQRGATWQSEGGKNLTVSFLLLDFIDKRYISDLSIAVSIAVFDTLSNIGVPSLRIKWPNDIMSGKRKLCGILIENVFKSGNAVASIVGIGINVNQESFPDLPNATSVLIEMPGGVDRQLLLEELIRSMNSLIGQYPQNRAHLYKAYHDALYRKGIPTAFESPDRGIFMGMIRNVSEDGRLVLRLEDDTLAFFSTRELKMLEY